MVTKEYIRQLEQRINSQEDKIYQLLNIIATTNRKVVELHQLFEKQSMNIHDETH